MKVRISIPIIITMELDDIKDLDDAKEQVSSICFDDPSIIVETIKETDDGNILMTFI